MALLGILVVLTLLLLVTQRVWIEVVPLSLIAALVRHARGSTTRLLLLLALPTALLSAFMNNTAIVALMIPVVFSGRCEPPERRSGDLDRALAAGHALAEAVDRQVAGGELALQGRRLLGRDDDQQAARGLRVEQELDARLLEPRASRRRPPRCRRARAGRRPSRRPAAASSSAPGKSGTSAARSSAAPRRSSARRCGVADEAEARDVGGGVRRRLRHRLRGGGVERRHLARGRNASARSIFRSLAAVVIVPMPSGLVR